MDIYLNNQKMFIFIDGKRYGVYLPYTVPETDGILLSNKKYFLSDNENSYLTLENKEEEE